MRSLRTKIALLVTFCTILTSVVIGGLSIQNSRKTIQEESVVIMNQICKNSSQQLNAMIQRIQQSVETLEACAVNGIDNVKNFQSSEEYVTEFTSSMENTVLSVADNTEGAVSIYVRYNPEFTSPTSGLFYSKNSGGTAFDKLVPTDFSIYDKSDVAHVGWYYIPIENKEATWMAPYLNENLNVYMISYVVPIFKDGVTIGIIGMDIDFSVIQEAVNQSTAYDTGYSFLVDSNANIMHHKELPINTSIAELNQDGSMDNLLSALQSEGKDENLVTYKYNGIKKEMVHQLLENGMSLILTAPLTEINASENRLIVQILTSTFLAVLVALFIALMIIRGIVSPLKELNQTTQMIANGDLDVTVSNNSKDEIGALAKNIALTVTRLKEYINYIDEVSSILMEIAGGNLVFKLQYEYSGEFAKVKVALETISSSLNKTLSEIHIAAEQVSNGSQQVSEGAVIMAQGAESQETTIEELSMSVSAISEQVDATAENAQQAYSLACATGGSAKESNVYMMELEGAMKRIAESSHKIQAIVKTVEDIASQTNILALNAAVESARAGEAGKGFAVVASEVRNLAVKVNEATKDIARLVHNSGEAIVRGEEIVTKTGESLKMVIDKTSIIEQKISLIATASTEQVNSLRQVTGSIEEISAVVLTNSATAEEGAASSKEMSGQAQVLKNLIAQFKLQK